MARLLGAQKVVRAAAVVLLCALTAAAACVAWPLPDDLLSREAIVSVRVTDRDGGLLREFRSREDGRGIPLPPGEIPPRVRDAFLSAEDRRFFSHPGVDPRAVLRAAAGNLAAGRIASGASTITMQLARRLEPRERTFAGKAAEALRALRLTAHLPRERILREYLDRVPLGNSTFGVEAAARTYFARPAAALSAGQAALLAGMARSPARHDPYRRPAAATSRMREVLGAMERLGWLTAEEARVARDAPLDLVPPERLFRAPHFVDRLWRALPRVGLDRAAEVRTTLDPGLQREVETAVREELSGLSGKGVGQAAALVVDNATGEVLAYVGSRDYLDDARGGQNDGVRSRRQPGSALKPFAYGLALASGYTPATVLSDVETHLATPSGDWVPRNYDRRVHGPVRLRAALANSYNVPAVRLADSLGPDRVLALLRAAGFESLSAEASHYGVGVVLGNGDVSLYELARAFRGLARGGVYAPLAEVTGATDASGLPLAQRPRSAPRRFLPTGPVALLTDILSDEVARAPAFGLDNALRLPFPVAAKTGTSRAYVDNWTAGYTAERTVAVWVGNFDGRPMRGVSGITGAGPLFRRVMLRAMEGLAPAPLLDRSRFARAGVCALSGQRTGPACPAAVAEIFLPGTEPSEPCAMHRFSGPDCGSRPILDVGPVFFAWARGEGLQPEAVPGCGTGPQGGAVARLLLPGDGDEYLLEPDLPAESQGIFVRALPPIGVRRLEVRTSDGPTLALGEPFSARLPAVRGQHRVELWVPGAAAPAAVARYTVR